MGAMIVERFGRKNSMLVMGVFLCFPWFMIAFANSIWVLYVARFIFGIAIGVMVIVSNHFIFIILFLTILLIVLSTISEQLSQQQIKFLYKEGEKIMKIHLYQVGRPR